MGRSIKCTLLEHIIRSEHSNNNKVTFTYFKNVFRQSAVKDLLELEIAFRKLFSKATNDLNFYKLVLCILNHLCYDSEKFCEKSGAMCFHFKYILMKNVVLILNLPPDDFERADFHFFHILWGTVNDLLPRILNSIKLHHILFTDFLKP